VSEVRFEHVTFRFVKFFFDMNYKQIKTNLKKGASGGFALRISRSQEILKFQTALEFLRTVAHKEFITFRKLARRSLI
jgi:hypothetical protein